MPSRDTSVRAATFGILGFRVAYGLALAIAPAKVAGNRWLGPGAAAAPAKVALRGMGVREVAVHGLALASLARGGPVRPLLAVSVAGDLADVTAAAIDSDGLPDGSAVATAAVAGGSAAISALLAALLPE
jgi:hypothetical protein